MNKSTHVAQVTLDPATPDKSEKAVVKYFPIKDRGWVNEYVGWVLAKEAGVKVPPRSALLIGEKSQITKDHGQELNDAAMFATEPFVLWCTSAIEPTKPVQQVLGTKWDQAILRTDRGKRLGALDGWIANCDRLEQNLLFWSDSCELVAIDHEKLAFNRDWTTATPPHLDDIILNGREDVHTTLIQALKKAEGSSEKAIRNQAKKAADMMFEESRTNHPKYFQNRKLEVKTLIDDEFSPSASQNLLSFLEDRLCEEVLKRRFRIAI